MSHHVRNCHFSQRFSDRTYHSLLRLQVNYFYSFKVKYYILLPVAVVSCLSPGGDVISARQTPLFSTCVVVVTVVCCDLKLLVTGLFSVSIIMSCRRPEHMAPPEVVSELTYSSVLLRWAVVIEHVHNKQHTKHTDEPDDQSATLTDTLVMSYYYSLFPLFFSMSLTAK